MKNALFCLLFLPVCVAVSAQGSIANIALNDLQLEQNFVEAGKNLGFSFNLTNTSTDTMLQELYGDFQIKVYLSSDTIPTEYDRLAVFPYQLLAPGATYTYHYTTYINKNYVTAGNKYLVVIAEYAYYSLEEIMLGKQQIRAIVNIKPFTGLPCTNTVANGRIECTSYLPNGQLNMIVKDGDTYKSYNIDSTGAVLAQPDPIAAAQFFLLIDQNMLHKKSSQGNLIYSKAIPTSLSSGYHKLLNAIEFGNGYIFSAFKNAPNTQPPYVPNTIDLKLTIIKTDENFNVLSTRVWNTSNEGTPNLYNIDNQYFTMGYSTFTSHDKKGYILVLNDSLTTYSERLVWDLQSYSSTDWGTGNPGIGRTYCGNFTYATYQTNSHYPYFNTRSEGTYQFNFEGPEFVFLNSEYASTLEYSSTGTKHKSFWKHDGNGGILSSESNFSYDPTVPLATQSELILRHKIDTNLVYEKKITPAELYDFKELVKVGQRYFLLNQFFGNITLTPVECDNTQPVGIQSPEMGATNDKIKIYPNPAQDYFYINGLHGHARASVFNLMGKQILQQQIDASGTGDVLIQINDIPAGAYIVSVVLDGGIKYALKLIIF